MNEELHQTVSEIRVSKIKKREKPKEIPEHNERGVEISERASKHLVADDLIIGARLATAWKRHGGDVGLLLYQATGVTIS